MPDKNIIGVTSVAFCQSNNLCSMLSDMFPGAVFNPFGRRLTAGELISHYKDCTALIVGLDKIDDGVLLKMPTLKIISKYGVGLDNIDLEACRSAGVEVLHKQGVNRRSVSELTLGFMLGHQRNIFVSDRKIREGLWVKSGGFELSGKTVGIIGMGNIGRDLISLLKPFGCRILGNDIIDIKEYCASAGVEESSKERIFSEADIISVHTPLTEETRNMICSESISMMKEGAFIINTARGGIADYTALKKAIQEGKIAGAAFDVYDEEPFSDTDLEEVENIYCTPHIGGNSAEAVFSMGEAAVNLLAEKYGVSYE